MRSVDYFRVARHLPTTGLLGKKQRKDPQQNSENRSIKSLVVRDVDSLGRNRSSLAPRPMWSRHGEDKQSTKVDPQRQSAQTS